MKIASHFGWMEKVKRRWRWYWRKNVPTKIVIDSCMDFLKSQAYDLMPATTLFETSNDAKICSCWKKNAHKKKAIHSDGMIALTIITRCFYFILSKRCSFNGIAFCSKHKLIALKLKQNKQLCIEIVNAICLSLSSRWSFTWWCCCSMLPVVCCFVCKKNMCNNPMSNCALCEWIEQTNRAQWQSRAALGVASLLVRNFFFLLGFFLQTRKNSMFSLSLDA